MGEGRKWEAGTEMQVPHSLTVVSRHSCTSVKQTLAQRAEHRSRGKVAGEPMDPGL